VNITTVLNHIPVINKRFLTLTPKKFKRRVIFRSPTPTQLKRVTSERKATKVARSLLPEENDFADIQPVPSTPQVCN
jgi:hypothetical protein